MSKEGSPDMVKLGEFDVFDGIKIISILVEQFPDCEFVIEEGKSHNLFILYSNCEKDEIRDAVDNFRNKYRKLKVADDSLTKSFPITLHK
ncbi:MAG: hypothetical protein ACXAEX_21580 [Promethearchaeota archaeon]|jgi:hypothetical protein